MQNNKSIVQNIQNYAEHTFDESYTAFSEIINSEPTPLCVPDYINNPLKYGFEDERLEKIWMSINDEIDKFIFIAIAIGLSQRLIERLLGISRSSVKRRIRRFKRFL